LFNYSVSTRGHIPCPVSTREHAPLFFLKIYFVFLVLLYANIMKNCLDIIAKKQKINVIFVENNF